MLLILRLGFAQNLANHVYILGGWLKQTPQENFSGRKALETLIIAILVTLISIAFNIPPAEALALLNQWIAAFIQLLTSTGFDYAV